MARSKQPISLIEAKGKKHLTKQEIEDRKNSEVKAGSDNVVAPSYLTKKQKETFEWYVCELKKIDIIGNIDVECLARYVVAEEQFKKVAKKIRTTDILNDDYDKLLVKFDKLYKICRQGSSDLGLTISSRCKLVIPKVEEKPKNKFEKFGAKNG
ncbi:phage terminase small subunit P27 family [Inediibacterium massiliense]|uniref:phage terminase small subunit P27 family n=1 Tax=Inediibacterium massiliense TaxID=1658111 RepID=UPI0006B4A4EC|nr:phage terminase small subunit P27 family [Inediibacterium massiliense]